jgi:hypothetical protein
MSTKRSVGATLWFFLPGVLSLAAQHLHAASPVPLEQVRNGEPGAVSAALAALSKSKAKPDRDLVDALQEALIVKPTTVLRAITDPQHMRLVCGPSVQQTYDLAENSLNERFSAVATEQLNSTDRDDKKRFTECGDELYRAIESAERRARATRAR